MVQRSICNHFITTFYTPIKIGYIFSQSNNIAINQLVINHIRRAKHIHDNEAKKKQQRQLCFKSPSLNIYLMYYIVDLISLLFVFLDVLHLDLCNLDHNLYRKEDFYLDGLYIFYLLDIPHSLS